ncbi:MAG: tetratricopeptide repeat protein [Candidatus Omnitrophica bacterium]|nr:tetratricopeptide repeat protein [Candidatus Omnitrophota bacterium]
MKPKDKKYILENRNKKIKAGTQAEKTAGCPRPAVVLISIALIIVLGFAAYANSLNGQFIRDDNDLIRDNPYIKNGISNALVYFTKNIAIGSGQKWNSYRPIQMITYAAEYPVWTLNVIGYHLTNILLHILTALFVYWLINILYNDNLLSLIAGALFVANPLHTEAVAYISGRADSLSAVFLLLCLIFYIKSVSLKRVIFYIPAILTYILAVFSRENSLILPALLLLYHYTFRVKIKLKWFLPILGVTFIYIFLRATVLKFSLSNIVYTTTLLERIPGFFAAVTDYLKLLLLPLDLHTGYGVVVFSPAHPKVISGILISVFLLIYAFKKRKTRSPAFFSICWFFISLLPQSNLYPINAYMAEHWLYLPSIGFFLLLSEGLSSLCKTEKFKILGAAFVIILLGISLSLTIGQNKYWKDPVSFFKRTLGYTPNDYVTYNLLGNAYEHSGNVADAVKAYKKAIEVNPNYEIPRYNLGTIYYNSGRKDEAIGLYKKAIEIKPDYSQAYLNLGSAYYDTGKTEEAIAAYEKAAKNNPGCAEAYYNLGVAYSGIGKKKEAISAYEKTLEIDPSDADAQRNLQQLINL